jgi:hypothetical protein
MVKVSAKQRTSHLKIKIRGWGSRISNGNNCMEREEGEIKQENGGIWLWGRKKKTFTAVAFITAIQTVIASITHTARVDALSVRASELVTATSCISMRTGN